jgi:hypothetical protein
MNLYDGPRAVSDTSLPLAACNRNGNSGQIAEIFVSLPGQHLIDPHQSAVTITSGRALLRN